MNTQRRRGCVGDAGAAGGFGQLAERPVEEDGGLVDRPRPRRKGLGPLTLGPWRWLESSLYGADGSTCSRVESAADAAARVVLSNVVDVVG